MPTRAELRGDAHLAWIRYEWRWIIWDLPNMSCFEDPGNRSRSSRWSYFFLGKISLVKQNGSPGWWVQALIFRYFSKALLVFGSPIIYGWSWYVLPKLPSWIKTNNHESSGGHCFQRKCIIFQRPGTIDGQKNPAWVLIVSVPMTFTLIPVLFCIPGSTVIGFCWKQHNLPNYQNNAGCCFSEYMMLGSPQKSSKTCLLQQP